MGYGSATTTDPRYGGFVKLANCPQDNRAPASMNYTLPAGLRFDGESPVQQITLYNGTWCLGVQAAANSGQEYVYGVPCDA